MMICGPKSLEAIMRHDPAAGAIVIMLRLKLYGMASCRRHAFGVTRH